MKNNIVLLLCIFETSDDMFMVSIDIFLSFHFNLALKLKILKVLTVDRPWTDAPLPHFEKPDHGLCCFAN